ncbi:MAG: N-acetylmuramoyl-L-alanine amidase [Candidatus Hydrogenedentes bacterium]|nr:N-acetylmuramoyl-L-alanine amidase [Candidatus Hydrogenedentota bacterium]
MLCILTGLTVGYLLLSSSAIAGSSPEVRKKINSYATAGIIDGRHIYVESGKTGRESFGDLGKELLLRPDLWRKFLTGNKLRVPYEELSDRYKLLSVRALFPKDSASERHWVHVVTYANPKYGRETLWRVAAWFTGTGTTFPKIKQYNGLRGDTIHLGQKIKIPQSLLLLPFIERQRIVTENGALILRGDYATYKLKKGESIYGDVVPHFTDMVDSKDVIWACGQIIRRSGIRDPQKIPPGTEIKIPIDLLAAKYRPLSDPRRARYEQFMRESGKYRPVYTAKDLVGVAVILDAGHGGKDPGTLGRLGIHEDDYVYDVMCRVKRLLERKTQARVVTTILDRSSKYQVIDATKFKADKDEYLLTTPTYDNGNPNVSANLRWYLANSLFRKLRREGFDKGKIVFTSFHADSLYASLRGLMVYVPNAYYSGGKNGKNDAQYRRYKEVRERPFVEFSKEMRNSSEKLSRDFSYEIKKAFRKKSLKVHNEPAVRGYVMRNRRVYVPAVLRYNETPIKVLVEIVNLNNVTDCKRIRNPQFREWVAEAYVQALQEFYSG